MEDPEKKLKKVKKTATKEKEKTEKSDKEKAVKKTTKTAKTESPNVAGKDLKSESICFQRSSWIQYIFSKPALVIH